MCIAVQVEKNNEKEQDVVAVMILGSVSQLLTGKVPEGNRR